MVSGEPQSQSASLSWRKLIWMKVKSPVSTTPLPEMSAWGAEVEQSVSAPTFIANCDV